MVHFPFGFAHRNAIFADFLAEMNHLPEIPASLRLLISGGDVLRGIYVDHLLDKAEVYNTYGPSETNVCASYYRCNSGTVLEDGTYPIAHPVKGAEIHILDPDGAEVPAGETGEICIYGGGVSLGYIGDHAEENKAFESLADGGRMYRSGDLGYLLPNGDIAFLHRKDTQIMIYGKRVEVAEVESRLYLCKDVRQAVVRVFTDEDGLSYITTLAGKNLAEATAMTLSELIPWVKSVPDTLSVEMRPMAESIIQSFLDNAKRLNDLGLGYLSLDRTSSTLSTGERQRVQLARAVRNETTGVLYVLDEPSIGLHPSNIDGLMEVVDSLIADGNSVVLVDHDVRVLKHADHMIELGPLAGTKGGTILAQGSIAEISKSPGSKIALFLTDAGSIKIRKCAGAAGAFDFGTIRMETVPIHTVHGLTVEIPKGRLTAVTGVSGSGKTTMVLESLIPGLVAHCKGEKLPFSVKSIAAEGIHRANLIDASPIGINIRSTVATYSGILDDLRKLYAGTQDAKAGKPEQNAVPTKGDSMGMARAGNPLPIPATR